MPSGVSAAALLLCVASQAGLACSRYRNRASGPDRQKKSFSVFCFAETEAAGSACAAWPRRLSIVCATGDQLLGLERVECPGEPMQATRAWPHPRVWPEEVVPGAKRFHIGGVAGWHFGRNQKRFSRPRGISNAFLNQGLRGGATAAFGGGMAEQLSCIFVHEGLLSTMSQRARWPCPSTAKQAKLPTGNIWPSPRHEEAKALFGI